MPIPPCSVTSVYERITTPSHHTHSLHNYKHTHTPSFIMTMPPVLHSCHAPINPTSHLTSLPHSPHSLPYTISSSPTLHSHPLFPSPYPTPSLPHTLLPSYTSPFTALRLTSLPHPFIHVIANSRVFLSCRDSPEKYRNKQTQKHKIKSICI